MAASHRVANSAAQSGARTTNGCGLDAVLTRERRSERVTDFHEMAGDPVVGAQPNATHLAPRPKRVALGFGQRVPPSPAHHDARSEWDRTGVDLGEGLLK